jgi:hypothetical protein
VTGARVSYIIVTMAPKANPLPQGGLESDHLAQYFVAHTITIPTICPETYSHAFDSKLKMFVPKLFRKSLANLRFASIQAWNDFDVHRNIASLAPAHSSVNLIGAYERNLEAQEAEFKEAQSLNCLLMTPNHSCLIAPVLDATYVYFAPSALQRRLGTSDFLTLFAGLRLF